jgi:hypothetical protein
MEVAGEEKQQKLVLTTRKGRDIINLIADNDANGYFLHHLSRGHLICYDYVGDQFSAASTAYYTYLRMLNTH